MAINSLLGVSDLVPRGKILQIVRATDATQRTTTSTSFVDASISVTITPQKSDSAIIVLWTSNALPASGTSRWQYHQITDSSNNALSGAEGPQIGINTTAGSSMVASIFGYSTPATTSATTYKGRFKAESGVTARIFNDYMTGQLYAIEVSA